MYLPFEITVYNILAMIKNKLYFFKLIYVIFISSYNK